MKKLSISIIAICFLIACGGGGYGSNENPNNPRLTKDYKE